MPDTAPPPGPEEWVPSREPRRQPTLLGTLVSALVRGGTALGWRLNLLLFLATIVTTTHAGIRLAADPAGGPAGVPAYLAAGLSYALPLILILGAHEMGHYLFCRYYGVEATLPFFIPAPIVISGTFGAVIRIKGVIPSRKALFDIGIAGPIAGFVAAIPVLAYGVATSTIAHTPKTPGVYLVFGDPILSRVFAFLLRGPLPEGMDYTLNGPFFAAWIGMLVTAMNLFPVGQLDGGHIVFALLPSHHGLVSRLTTYVMIALVAGTLLRPLTILWPLGTILALLFYGAWQQLTPSSRFLAAAGITALVFYCALVKDIFSPWLVWALVLMFVGRRPHPSVPTDAEPLGLFRRALAAGAFGILVVCFMPVPIQTFTIEPDDRPQSGPGEIQRVTRPERAGPQTVLVQGNTQGSVAVGFENCGSGQA